MIRRLTAALLALMMAVALLPAAAEDGLGDLCGIYEGDELRGVGVPLVNGSMVLTSGCTLLNARSLQVRAGDQMIEAVDVNGADYDEPVLLQMERNTGLTPWKLAPEMDPAKLTYYGMLSDGTVVSGDCTRVAPAFSGGHAAMTLTAQEGLLPGTLILDETGGVTGMVIGVYGEGVGRYLAYTAESLYFMITLLTETEGAMPRGTTTAEPAAPAATNKPTAEELGYTPITDATLVMDRGFLWVTWDQEKLDPANGEVMTTLFVGMNAPYSITAVRKLSDGGCQFPAAPEQTYVVFLMQSQEVLEMESIERDYDSVLIKMTDAAQPFTDYQFKDTEFRLGVLPKGRTVADTEIVPAPTVLTAAVLENNDVYMQVTGTYQVTERVETTLVVVLTAPNGWVLTDYSGYLFDPSVMTGDVWHMSLNPIITDLCEASDTGHVLPGEYTLTYYLDGMMASTTTFVVE